MTRFRWAIVPALLVSLVAVLPASAQTVAVQTQALSAQEIEGFLLNSRIVDRKSSPKGVTDAYRVTLSDGKITHDAQVQNIDVSRAVFEVAKYTELNFKDTYRYNVAGYRLARLLGLTNVPVSVPRTMDGKQAAVTWWIDDVAFDETGRVKAKANGPNPQRMAGYVHILRVFDELIQNRDRNSGNFVWTKDWTMWLIDHTRAFRNGKELLKPALLQRCERSMCAAMRAMTRESLVAAVGNTLEQPEVDSLMGRRDVILKIFDDRIAQRGEASVLFTLPQQ